jgi:hypothetical protein
MFPFGSQTPSTPNRRFLFIAFKMYCKLREPTGSEQRQLSDKILVSFDMPCGIRPFQF